MSVFSVDASPVDWQFYRGGEILAPADCSKGNLNHAVNIVGYGKDDESGKDYWIVRNSWNTWWGDGGYAYLERGSNMCGVATRPAYASYTNLRT